MKFEVNMGVADRFTRLVIGLALIGLAQAGLIGAWGLIGLVALLSAMPGFCPVYALLGVRTSRAA